MREELEDWTELRPAFAAEPSPRVAVTRYVGAALLYCLLLWGLLGVLPQTETHHGTIMLTEQAR